MPANEWRTSGWDFPTKEMLDDLTRGVKPDLRIDGLRLRLLSSKAMSNRTDRQSGQNIPLDFLPDPGDGLLLPCEVHVTVLDTRTTTKGRVIHVEQHEATIVRRVGSDGDQTLDVRLAKAFHIKLGNIFQAEACGTNGQRRWKRTVINSYSLEISLHFAESAHSAQFLSVVESCHADHFNGRPANEGIVRATWDKLPNCPSSGRLLPLKRAFGHKSLDLKYGLEVSMGWNKRRESELVRHNRMMNSPSQQLPTPSSSDDLEVGAGRTKGITVRYQRQVGIETNITNVQSLDCILCTSASGDDRQRSNSRKTARQPPASSFERLLFHYRCFHGYLDWQLGERLESDDGAEIVCVNISDKEKGVDADARAQENTHEGYSWIAPSRPFDLKAFAAGDERWIGGGQRVSEQSRRKGRFARQGATRPEEVIHTVPPRLRQVLAVEDVPNLPVSQPRHSVVPDIMDVTFYHSSSKLPIKAGETLRHGEADGDDNRLLHSQRRDLLDAGLSFEARAFHKAFNKHLDIEQPIGRASIRDTSVRFVRKYRDAHHSGGWLDELQAKLIHLRDHGLLDSDAVKYCLGIMSTRGSAKAEADHSNGTPKRDESLPGNGQARSNGRFASASQGSAKKKPHRWSGGGADKDIIQSGVGTLHSSCATKKSSGALYDAARADVRNGSGDLDDDTIMADVDDDDDTAVARGIATSNGGPSARIRDDEKPIKRRRVCACGPSSVTILTALVVTSIWLALILSSEWQGGDA
ncbi:hypothetical protein LTS14_005875 [Recurvomyces mirabilis]|uniref:uncharacterized protein n=1 Tax=Recurvomyces mirabilis TaxID=574656 RepID=UPI002DE1ED3F|nr:hypothetical protein LTS14_005875 [Recurvomyces mirabilis]